ncbi:MAG: hypothetical protein J0M28_14055 [Thauera sp.]|nr:hypothetical protein [Thauera sp.]
MITLEDCTAFCDASELDVARIARERQLTMAAAIACAHAHHLARAERKRKSAHREPRVHETTGGKRVETAPLQA